MIEYFQIACFCFFRSLCKLGYPEELDKFLKGVKDKHGTLDIDVATEDGWTCLHDMITHECQFTQVAEVLIRHGANVNTTDLNGDSPLHSALLYHNTDNIKLLLEGRTIETSPREERFL